MEAEPASGPERRISTVFVAVLSALAGCGLTYVGLREPTVAAQAVPQSVPRAAAACPVSGAQVASIVHSPLVTLLRARDGVCAYGVRSFGGRASLASPIVRIAVVDHSVRALRKGAVRRDLTAVTARSDLGRFAFARHQELRRGRQRVTFAVPRNDDGSEAWQVSADVPAGGYALADAAAFAEQITQLLAPQAPAPPTI